MKSYPSGWLFLFPFSGWIINHFGSRNMVITSDIIYTILLVLVGLSQSLLPLVIVLFALGFFSNLLPHL